jgi:hypothetical protein
MLSAANSAGIAPRSTYLKVIGDFCRWNDRLVFGCDDTAQSEFLNKDRLKGDLAGPGRSQSNLWLVEPPRLDGFGPALGRGAVWLNDDLQAGVASEPFLFSGFAKRSLHLAHAGASQVGFTLEVDAKGDGRWKKLREVTVPARGSAWLEFPQREAGAWIRLTPQETVPGATAFFHYRADDPRTAKPSPIFDGLATPGEQSVHGGVMHARGADHQTLRFVARNRDGEMGGYDLDGDLKLRRASDPEGVTWSVKAVAIAPPLITADAASLLYVDDNGQRWRLPKGDPALDRPGPLGHARLCREVVTERNLLNVGGTFYELPAQNAGGFVKIRPITTHNRRIHDFASYRGLLVLSGLSDDAQGGRIIRSEDGKCALWVGAVDDLWQFGKPRGRGGPWLDTGVRAGQPSDAYLAAGYDRKRLRLSHGGPFTVNFTIQADFTGTGTWSDAATIRVKPRATAQHRLPDAFGAYWLRVTASADTTATAQFEYD